VGAGGSPLDDELEVEDDELLGDELDDDDEAELLLLEDAELLLDDAELLLEDELLLLDDELDDDEDELLLLLEELDDDEELEDKQQSAVPSPTPLKCNITGSIYPGSYTTRGFWYGYLQV